MAVGVEEAEVDQAPRASGQALAQGPAGSGDPRQLLREVVHLEDELDADRGQAAVRGDVLVGLQGADVDVVAREGEGDQEAPLLSVAVVTEGGMSRRASAGWPP